MAQKSAFTSAWAWADTLARVLRARWTRHRWPRLAGNTRSKAPVSPGAPSLIPSSGARRPRSLRSARKSSQASVDSDAAGARPTNTGLPSTSMPQAAKTGSAGAPECILQVAGVQEQVVQPHPGQLADPPGGELRTDRRADPADGRLRQRGLGSED